MSMLESALKYADMGIPVFPLGPHSKRPLITKRQNGKGVLDATTDKDKIRNWWTANPNANIGGACGYEFVALDIDPGGEGFISEELINTDGPHTTTPRGGKHYLFKCPDQRLPGIVGFAPHLDFRSKGNYIVLPPSVVNEEGVSGSYEWQNDDLTQMPPVPDWIVSKLTNPQKTEKAERVPLSDPILDGSRDVDFTSRIGRVIARGMAYEDVLTIAHSLNNSLCKPPLKETQVIKIVNSIWKREKDSKETKEAKPFILKTFNTMLHEYALKEESFMVDQWLPEGSCALVTAQPGMFKTWFVLAMAISVSTGTPFLGRHKINNPGPVVVIQQEDSYAMLLERIAQIGGVTGTIETAEGEFETGVIQNYENLLWYDSRDFRFDDPAMMESFSATMRMVKPRMVMIDPLYSAGDTDDYMAKTAKNMLVLKKLRDELGTSFVIVHHMGKSGDGKSRARDMAWGSQFLNAWLETGWQFIEGEDCDVQIHRHHKNTGKVVPLNANVNIGNFSFNVEYVDSGEVEEVKSLEERAVAMVESGRIKNLTHVMDSLDIKSKATAHRLMLRIGAIKTDKGYRMKSEPQMEED